MNCAFFVGQKVVCIEKNWVTWLADGTVVAADSKNKPQNGEVYTVRGFYIAPEGIVYIYLVEIVNPITVNCDGTREKCFDARLFRPLNERKTDISVFQEIRAPRKTERV